MKKPLLRLLFIALFPDGVQFSDGKFRIDAACLMFTMLEGEEGK